MQTQILFKPFVAAVVLGAAATGLAACGSTADSAGEDTVVVTETVAAADAAAEDVSASTESAPKPQVVKGSGAKVKTIEVKRDSPLVVRASHSGSSNFIVHLTGGGETDYLFNEIGNLKNAATLVAEPTTGTRRVKVDADGSWVLTFTQPDPPENATPIPGTLSGKGSAVVWVRADDDFEPIITGTTKGDSNFIVHLVSANGAGTAYLFNEIGPWSGETTEEIPEGSYLMSVDADASWAVKFSN